MFDRNNAAKAIRKELKAKFPHVKFSVTGQRCAIHVTYPESVKREQVEKITNKYEAATYDALSDYWSYDNKNDNLPQAEYVVLQRAY